MKNKVIGDAARLLFEELQLEGIKRSVRYLNPSATGPSVAEHTGTTAKIAWVLAGLAEGQGMKVDRNKVVELILWHDTEETRTWDQGYDIKKYLQIDEEKALREKLGGTAFGDEILALKRAFESESSKDVNVLLAKDADVIYVILTIKKMMAAGININKPKERFVKVSSRLKTKVGRSLAKELTKRDPNEWWDIMMGYKKR
jgi:5'-deoxynucleotidase YfbR-like HD superfamily hydrolase